MSANSPDESRTAERVVQALTLGVAFAVFARTAYPNITWWDSSSYSLAAATFGVSSPPGSLLLMLAGWVVTRLPTGLAVAHALNLFAGVLATITVALIGAIATRLWRITHDEGLEHPATVGAALGSLTFAFSETFWQYAVQFTPYILTTVFTALLLWSMLRWWQNAERPDAWRWLLLIGLLIGLDFSVHRTNALLLPGLLVWITLRDPRTLRSWRAWVSGAGGMLAGLSFQLLIIPVAAAQPVMNMGDPSNWPRFWDYVSLAQYGGGFLVQFTPRNAPLWSVQSMDLVRAFGANFFSLSGGAGALGALPGAFGSLGFYLLWKRERRLAIALAALFLVHAATTIAYFNIREHYFRSLNRHYLPVFVTFGALMAYGMGDSVARLARLRWFTAWRAAGVGGLLLSCVVLSPLRRNWEFVDGSARYFAKDFAMNMLNSLPERAILFTVGDNDTWPLWYMHEVEQVRPDVRIINASLTNASWFTKQVVQRDPAFPLSGAARDYPLTRAWSDTTITIPARGSSSGFALPDSAVLPEAIAVHASPTMDGKQVLRQDLVLLDILKTNEWRRPLVFSVTSGGNTWLQPFMRLDGLFWRVVPYQNPPLNRELLRQNLLERYTYRGYAATDVLLDDVSDHSGSFYHPAFIALAKGEAGRGDTLRCRETRERLLRVLPLSRVHADSTTRRTIDTMCE